MMVMNMVMMMMMMRSRFSSFPEISPVVTKRLDRRRRRCLHIESSFLPNFVSTPSVRPDSLA